jgi:hypothetical protein
MNDVSPGAPPAAAPLARAPAPPLPSSLPSRPGALASGRCPLWAAQTLPQPYAVAPRPFPPPRSSSRRSKYCSGRPTCSGSGCLGCEGRGHPSPPWAASPGGCVAVASPPRPKCAALALSLFPCLACTCDHCDRSLGPLAKPCPGVLAWAGRPARAHRRPSAPPPPRRPKPAAVCRLWGPRGRRRGAAAAGPQPPARAPPARRPAAAGAVGVRRGRGAAAGCEGRARRRGDRAAVPGSDPEGRGRRRRR